jgi:hypothetical protein
MPVRRVVALSALALAVAVIARAEVGQGQDIDPVLSTGDKTTTSLEMRLGATGD